MHLYQARDEQLDLRVALAAQKLSRHFALPQPVAANATSTFKLIEDTFNDVGIGGFPVRIGERLQQEMAPVLESTDEATRSIATAALIDYASLLAGTYDVPRRSAARAVLHDALTTLYVPQLLAS